MQLAATEFLVCSGGNNIIALYNCTYMHASMHTHKSTTTVCCCLTTRLAATPYQQTEINLVETKVVYQHTS